MRSSTETSMRTSTETMWIDAVKSEILQSLCNLGRALTKDIHTFKEFMNGWVRRWRNTHGKVLNLQNKNNNKNNKQLLNINAKEKL